MSKLNILVVDDAAFIRDFIRRGLLEKFPHFTVEDAIHGRDAQQKLEQNRYDIVLCDWEMPEMSGEELLKWLRGREETAKLPFIMVTSRGEREHVMKAVQAGASNYVVKPFTMENLLPKIAQALKGGGRPAGAKPAAPKPAPASAAGGPDGSAAILTAGRAIPKPKAVTSAAADSVSILTGGKPAAAAKAAASGPQPTCSIRFGSESVPGVLKNITLTGVEAVIRRQASLPTLLTPLVVDIEASQVNETLRMNAFVHRIQASAPNLDAPQFQLYIRFADDDPVKNENLSKFITSLRGR